MKLESIQRALHAAVKDQRPLAEVAAELGADTARLAIYRRMIRGHVRAAVTGRLEVCCELLGAGEDTPAWQVLFEGYLAACPPAHWALGEAAAGFPGYLATRLEQGDPAVQPFHVAVAELEWSLFQTNRDETQLPEPRALSVPILNPTLQVLEWPWPVASFMTAWSRGTRPPLPTTEVPEMALVFRRPATGNPCFYVGTPTLLFALKVTHDGLSVAEAVAQSGQPPEAVTSALDVAAEIGLVLRPT